MNSHSMPDIDSKYQLFILCSRMELRSAKLMEKFFFLTTFLSEVVIDNILQNIYSKILKCKPGCDIE